MASLWVDPAKLQPPAPPPARLDRRPALLLEGDAGAGDGAEAYLVFGSSEFGREAERARLGEQLAAQRAGEAPALGVVGAAGSGPESSVAGGRGRRAGPSLAGRGAGG